MSKGGWIKLHRQLLANPIFKNDKLFRVFIYLLLSAQHTEGDLLIGDAVVHLEVGQWATGRHAIARDTGLTEQNVRTALSKLEKLGMLTIKPTTKYSIFSITNWSKYQQDNQQVTNSQPTANQQVTTNNNVKKEKNDQEGKELTLTSGKPPAKKKFNDEDIRFCEWFYQQMLVNSPDMKKPNFEIKSWADSVRLMRERDGKTHKQMAELFAWVVRDSFWRTNVMCPEKLRKQWDQLELKSKEPVNQYKQRGEHQAGWSQDILTNGEIL